MDDVIHKEEYRGFSIEIKPDTDIGDSPRDWDNLGTMVCFHGRYALGDEGHGYSANQQNSWGELAKRICRDHDIALIYPLFLYDHSGLRLKMGSFQGHLPQGHAEFDSGQVGFIYATKDDLRKNYGVKNVTKNVLDMGKIVLEGEVDTYDMYLAGAVYGYVVLDQDGETYDSCWGFYDYDWNYKGVPLEEARGVVDWYWEDQKKKHKEMIKDIHKGVIGKVVPLHA